MLSFPILPPVYSAAISYNIICCFISTVLQVHETLKAKLNHHELMITFQEIHKSIKVLFNSSVAAKFLSHIAYIFTAQSIQSQTVKLSSLVHGQHAVQTDLMWARMVKPPHKKASLQIFPFLWCKQINFKSLHSGHKWDFKEAVKL